MIEVAIRQSNANQCKVEHLGVGASKDQIKKCSQKASQGIMLMAEQEL